MLRSPSLLAATFCLILWTVLTALSPATVGAVQIANSRFERAWARTDLPVASGQATRTWIWGPEPFTDELSEPYDESPAGARAVLYFDKSRMEISHPDGDPDSPWYVTNGLLVAELISGQVQVGDNRYETRTPAQINVAGDPDDPNGPTYATFTALLDALPGSPGEPITQRLHRDGTVEDDPKLAVREARVGYLDEITNHSISAAFWDFMHSSGLIWNGSDYVEAQLFADPYFATGRPITEAYWTTVEIGGTATEVLVQCFERRCLTYTPDNPPAWRVEAGNVGQHYYQWRYADALRCGEAEIELTDNLVVTQDTTFCGRNYAFSDPDRDGVISVGADDITLDGGGLVLDGSDFEGIGIYLNGHIGVTIRNFTLRHFYYAIWAEDASHLLIEGNDLSNNSATDNFGLRIVQPLEETLGGGILFDDVTDSTVQGNQGNNQDLGINIYGGSNNLIQQNDFSNNSAWGIRLVGSTSNVVQENQAHHVNRCSEKGCDSAGILMTEGSNNNQILNNDLSHSGNGFFLGNQKATPSNDNLIEGNDGSFASNNAFEATFGSGNILRDNVAENSKYGFWLGFSQSTRLEGNTIRNNEKDGIKWEHGHDGEIVANLIAENQRDGIAFDVDPENQEFLDLVTSEAYIVRGNTIRDNRRRGISMRNTTSCRVEGNRIEGNLAANLYFVGATFENVVTGNDLLGTPVMTLTAPGNDQDARNNWWGTNNRAAINELVVDGNDGQYTGLILHEPWLSSSPVM